MQVLNTTSPAASTGAPNRRPRKTRPSSRTSDAGEWVAMAARESTGSRAPLQTHSPRGRYTAARGVHGRTKFLSRSASNRMFLLRQSTHRTVLRHDPEIGHLFVPNLVARIPSERGGYFV